MKFYTHKDYLEHENITIGDVTIFDYSKYIEIPDEFLNLSKQTNNENYIKAVVDIYIQVLMWKFYGKISEEEFNKTKELIEQLNLIILKRRLFTNV